MDRRPAVLRVILSLSIASTLAGCYSYTVVPPQDATVGQGVRARVTGAQAEQLEPVLGMTNREIEGQLIEQHDSSIVLSVAIPLSTAGGGSIERGHQRIVIPRTELQELQLRHLDRTRTSLLVGAGIGAVAVAVAASAGKIDLGQGGSRGNPNREVLPIPLTLLRVPLGHNAVDPPASR